MKSRERGREGNGNSRSGRVGRRRADDVVDDLLQSWIAGETIEELRDGKSGEREAKLRN